MAHLHSLYDTDPHFKIDEETRQVTNASEVTGKVVQYDHNSERLTFELPRYIDGHDMSACNSVQVHYINVDSANKNNKYTGVYEVDDLQTSPNSEEVTICSWLLSRNATQYAGLLSFVLCFICTDDGALDYAWNTEIYTGLTVSAGINNGEVIVEEYADILASWEARISALEQGGTAGAGAASVEPAEDDIPKVFFGGALQQTKDEAVVPFRYISKTQDITGYAEIKAQGNSSMNYAKKNQTVKLFKDADCTEKLKVDFKGWGKQNKHCYKANWIDLTHARNIVSARLWGDIVKSRSNYAELPEELRTSPNQGAVDGFPVKVYAAGVYQGRYTINIPKDKWMANMDDNLDTHCILCGENYASGCFRAAANIDESDWTDEIHDSVPASILTRWNEVISFVMNSTDEDFKANLGNYFDVPSLIDYHLFGLQSCGLDAYGKNQLYFTYDGLKWIAVVYDMDSTWGLYWNGSKFVSSSYTREEYEDMISGREGNLLYIRLEQLFYAELQSRWAELKNGALSIENIINHFERFTDIAPTELVKEDYASTTGGGAFTGIPSTSTNNIQQIRAFALARQAWTDEYVAGLTGESGGDDSGDSGEEDTTASCTGISLSASTMTFTAEGMQTLTAMVTPDGCTDAVTWETTDSSVATVSNGVVTAVGNGNATITVRCGNYSANCAVSVSGIVVDETMIYKLPTPTTFDGATTFVDTGIQLFDTDKDFTLFLRFAGSDTNIAYTTATVCHCMNEVSPHPGLSVAITGGYCLNYYSGKHIDFWPYNDTEMHTMVLRKTADSNKAIAYFDGISIALNGGNFTAVTQNLLLGCYQTSNGTKGRFWSGTIYECKVWGRALSDTEITNLSGVTFSETYLRQDYSPSGESFIDEVEVDFANGDYVVSEIDLTTCNDTNECLLSVGVDIANWSGGNVHTYRQSENTVEFHYVSATGSDTKVIKTFNDSVLTFTVRNNALLCNGEVIVITDTTLASAKTVQVGSAEGNTRSNATYNYIKVCRRT